MRVEMVLEAGCDQFGGEACPELVVELVMAGRVSEDRVDVSVRRLLLEKFRLGLFDQRYLDIDAAATVVGRADFVKAGKIKKLDLERHDGLEDLLLELGFRQGPKKLTLTA